MRPPAAVIDVGKCTNPLHQISLARPSVGGSILPASRHNVVHDRLFFNTSSRPRPDASRYDASRSSGWAAYLRHQRCPSRRHLLPDVLQHEFLRDGVKHDLAARWQKRETLLDLALQRLSPDAGEGSEPLIETKLAALMPDEIQRGSTVLPW